MRRESQREAHRLQIAMAGYGTLPRLLSTEGWERDWTKKLGQEAPFPIPDQPLRSSSEIDQSLRQGQFLSARARRGDGHRVKRCEQEQLTIL
jgi:hypothetical protein